MRSVYRLTPDASTVVSACRARSCAAALASNNELFKELEAWELEGYDGDMQAQYAAARRRVMRLHRGPLRPRAGRRPSTDALRGQARREVEVELSHTSKTRGKPGRSTSSRPTTRPRSA